MAMKAPFLGFTLLKSPWGSSAKTPFDRLTAVFKEPYVGSQKIRIRDYDVAFGVSSDKREGDVYYPGRIIPCDIGFIATLTWSEVPAIVKEATGKQDGTYIKGDLKICQYPFYGKAVDNAVSGTEDCQDVDYAAQSDMLSKISHGNPTL
ncbi:hypothetical protein MTHERMMSTA1_06780 [Methanosarcina thermophila MST-A1]|jgi:hypothetical protein|uniref:BRAMP n=1 Tax=Methanosarcina thermophila TaxID=2210 RepID=A0A3G9CTH5_METTE|nr:hypothetical protein [Methanosarcina thermophila]NLU57545.1 hypothetical protein [Methanosarcina thermophila]BAW29403.1 BRAMP [Methanosarcina thermophila]GLI13552.1 hypothetical protein MTHERMMSTA1_06780 [Methanosarcina thermophila MST-A1]HOA67944.1 hypothetical protein [Methanosarcina thermophila]HOQ66572.1 hypothetical protein [Methanosarcina thermophila]